MRSRFTPAETAPEEINVDASAPSTARIEKQTGRARARTSRPHTGLRRWKLPITDGPFAESKEMLGGGSGHL